MLVVAPYGRDAESVVRLLCDQDYDAHALPDLDVLATHIDEHVGVIVMTHEAMRGGTGRLRDALAAQPAWSDVPFILLASKQPHGRSGGDAFRSQLLEFTGNVVVLERPLSLASLVSATTSAMRSRQRQFDMRDRLAELEQGRAALAASEAELRTVADALPSLIAFVDRDRCYRFANRAYEAWFGRPLSDVVGKPVIEVVGPAAYALRADGIERALRGEEVRMELPWPHPDGRHRDAEIRYMPRRDAAGDIDGFHIFVLDITERKVTENLLSDRVAERTAALEAEIAARDRVEAALRQSQKMEAVGQLTGGIAHDFNNMLTGVIGAMDIIKRRLKDGRYDDLDRFLDAATTSAQRAAALTARLLAFSRQQSLDAKPTDIDALLRSLEDLLRRTIPENVALRIVSDESVDTAIVDANQLENAILNLAINARDAMPDGGQLTIESRVVDLDDAYVAKQPDIEPGRYVIVSVSDSGVGMAPELLEKAFDPFFTTKPIGQGTGLGLSMVYGFARQSGGQVRIHSQIGRGTTVSIYLRASTEASDTGPRAPVADAPDGNGQSVLLVEDDPSVRMLVRDVLEELSYRAIEAEEATAAIAILRSDAPIDLMVSDVGLPGINGRQLAEIARSHRPDLPILFVTGYAENAANRAGFLGTNMAMITKPFAIESLSAKIREMLA